MSAQAMSWAWRQADPCGDQGTHLVLLALAEHASPDGNCWPARKTMAKMVGYATPGSITKKMKKLEDAGLLKREDRYVEMPEGGRRRTSNIYRLQMDPVDGGDQGVPPPEESIAPNPDQFALVSADQTLLPAAGHTLLPAEQPARTNNKNQQQEVTATELTPEEELTKEVQAVWDYYVAAFDPPRAKLGPSRVRGIERALKEVDVATLIQAIDGLKNFRAHRPGDTSLETVWKTYKGTGSMVERIEFFASQAKGSTPGGQAFPSAQAAIVSQRQLDVQRGHRFGEDSEMVERAKRSEAWLREHGIETVRGDDGYPTFAAMRKGAV